MITDCENNQQNVKSAVGKMIPILIPAYKPDEKLIDLVRSLTDFSIVVVRDGGGPEFDPIFKSVAEEPHVNVVVHATNLGKGRALKTGINALWQLYPEALGCITADADGQHTPEDIRKIAERMLSRPNALWLGVRHFEATKIPLRSRIGNQITLLVFAFLAGHKVSDTQTGLRGIPAAFFDSCMHFSGEKYEFETNMLLGAIRQGIPIAEQEIETVYIDDNKSSHFNPLTDSIKIYATLLKYGFSGIFSAVLDYLVFTLLFLFSGRIALSTYAARAVSLSLNFAFNKKIVFGHVSPSRKQTLNCLWRYILLCIVSATLSFLLVWQLNELVGLPVLVGKILVEVLLFFMNFVIQRKWVFKTRPEAIPA